jgi:hypothetical protein
VNEQRDGLEDRRGDALEHALDQLADDHRQLRVGRRARVVRRTTPQPHDLDGGSQARQHQAHLLRHRQLAVVLGHHDGQ